MVGWSSRPRIPSLTSVKDRREAEREFQETCTGLLRMALAVACAQAAPREPTTVEILDAIDMVAECVRDSVQDGRADRARAELAKGLKP